MVAGSGKGTVGSAAGGGESGAIELSELLPLWLGIGAIADDRTVGEASAGGADSDGGKVSALFATGPSGAGGEYLGGSGGRGATSGTGADAAWGSGSISVLGSALGDSEACASGSGVGDAEAFGSGCSAGVSGLGDSEGCPRAAEGAIGSGILLLSEVGLGRLLSWSGGRGLLSTDGWANIGPDKSRDLSKSSRDGKG